MPLHLLAWKIWNFLCDLPCSELSKGTSGWIEGSERAAPRGAGKLRLQHWEAVAAGARRVNAAWHCLCSYAACGEMSEDWEEDWEESQENSQSFFSGLLWEDACPMQSCGHGQWGTWHNILCVPGHLSVQGRQWAGLEQWAGWVSELLTQQQHNQVVGRSFPGGTFRQSWTP